MSFPRAARLATLALALAGLTLAAGPAPDPLATAIARWAAVARDTTSLVEMTRDTRQFVRPVISGAETALQGGRRMLALYRLSYAWPHLDAAEYVASQTAAGHADSAGLEAEWKRMKTVLGSAAAKPSLRSVADLKPAAVRAFAETALPQVGIYHEASLDYGRATGAESGLYYLGSALGQKQFVEFSRTLAEPVTGQAIVPRDIAAEIDALERLLLAAYQPPASIDSHRDFIVASAAIKEARELEALGFHHGALVRYLLAAMRVGVIRRGVAPREIAPIARQIETLAARLEAERRDHSIGRFFLETAAADLATRDSSHTTAQVVVDEVLPLYFAALGPAPAAAPRAAPEVTVTLVRWPYT
jgi:hypothetical protein